MSVVASSRGIGFASFTKRHAWVKSLITRLKLLGEVFALALARKRAEENLAAALAEIKRLEQGKATSSEPRELLCSNFGLTAAEAYIAIGIARGETLAVYSHQSVASPSRRREHN